MISGYWFQKDLSRIGQKINKINKQSIKNIDGTQISKILVGLHP